MTKASSPPAINFDVVEQRYRDRYGYSDTVLLAQAVTKGGVIFGRIQDSTPTGPWLCFRPDGSVEEGILKDGIWHAHPESIVKGQRHAKLVVKQS